MLLTPDLQIWSLMTPAACQELVLRSWSTPVGSDKNTNNRNIPLKRKDDVTGLHSQQAWWLIQLNLVILTLCVSVSCAQSSEGMMIVIFTVLIISYPAAWWHVTDCSTHCSTRSCMHFLSPGWCNLTFYSQPNTLKINNQAGISTGLPTRVIMVISIGTKWLCWLWSFQLHCLFMFMFWFWWFLLFSSAYCL